jgi:hypothetical protein
VSIADKERQIYELKKKNQELEKFKFVLDYKIKELKQQIEPREAEIGTMKKQIKEVRGGAARAVGGATPAQDSAAPPLHDDAVHLRCSSHNSHPLPSLLPRAHPHNRWTRSSRRTTPPTRSWTA